ncbi:MAG: sugar phosphate isomerase/epimerase family protein [Capsulimonadaceae bacterium]
MKLAVSTLGCPEWTLDEIIDRCREFGYEAVELRGLGEHLDLAGAPEFATDSALAATRRRFEDAGLALAGIDSSVKFSDPETTDDNLDAARRAVDMAAALGAPFVRIFGGAIPEGVTREDAVRLVADCLRTSGEYAASRDGVSVLLETHDAFSTGAEIADVLRLVDHPRVGVLWDLHHPPRHQETPAQTALQIGGRVRLTHVKDSRPGEPYCLLGEGDIPIFEGLQILNDLGYDGYVSVEWEKRWVPGLLEPEIVFPQYASKLREYLARLN